MGGSGTEWQYQWGLADADREALDSVRGGPASSTGMSGGSGEYAQGMCRKGWAEGIVSLLWRFGKGLQCGCRVLR